MANVGERCKHSMSIHDNHASCPQCRIAAGGCTLDLDKPCGICANWTRRQWGKLRRSLIEARARSTQRGRQHWSAAFPRLEAWILSKPVSTSVSEISSHAGEEDFEDNVLASTPNQQVEQVLVVQAQNGVNMASGMSNTAPSTAIMAQSTAPSTAPLQVAGPSTMEPAVPIGEQVGQDTPSVIQGARPEVRIEQTAQPPQMYGAQPYISGQQYTAPLPCTAPQPYAAPYVPAMSARPALSMGHYGQGNQFPFVPNPGWLTQEQLLQQQQLLQERREFEAWRASRAQANLQPQPQMTSAGQVQVESNVNISQGSASVARARPEDQTTIKAKAKRTRSAPTSRRSPSPKRDYPRGTCTATRPSQASPKRAQDSSAPDQDIEAFWADMTCCQTCFNPPLVLFASQFKPSSGGQGESVSTQNVASVHEGSTSDQEDQSEGKNVNSEGDPVDMQGIPTLDSLRMTEEEERVSNTFSLPPVTVPKRSWI